GVARLDARSGGPVAEVPGVGESVSVQDRRAAAVEADDGALGGAVRSAGRGRGRAIDGRIVTGAAAHVAERLPPHGHELPGVAVGIQGELQHPEGKRQDLAVGRDDGVGSREALASGADVELLDAVRRVYQAGRVHRGEALVVVLLCVQHHVRPGGVQPVPDGLDRARRREPGRVGGTEPGDVPERERALLAVRGEVALEPLVLRGAGVEWYVGTVGVEDDDVPSAHVEAVVAQAARSPAPTSTPKPPAVAIVAVVAAGGLARPRVSVTVSVTV